MITINSELDLFDKTGNSTHARWIAEKFLSARRKGVITEVELAVLDASLADDFGKYKNYRAGLRVENLVCPGAEVDMGDLFKDKLSEAIHETIRDRCRREMKVYYLDGRCNRCERDWHEGIKAWRGGAPNADFDEAYSMSEVAKK